MDGSIILSRIQTSRHFVEDFRKFLLVFTNSDVLVLDRIDCWNGPPGHQGCRCSMFGGHILPGCPGRVSAYIIDIPFLSAAYAILDPEQEETIL